MTDSGAIHVKEEFMVHLVQAKDRAVQLGRWKLVWRPTKTSGIVELYDRISDPLNRYNLAKQNPRIVAHLGLKMLPFLRFDGEKNPMFQRWKLIEERNGPPDLLGGAETEEAKEAIQDSAKCWDRFCRSRGATFCSEYPKKRIPTTLSHPGF